MFLYTPTLVIAQIPNGKKTITPGNPKKVIVKPTITTGKTIPIKKIDPPKILNTPPSLTLISNNSQIIQINEGIKIEWIGSDKDRDSISAILVSKNYIYGSKPSINIIRSSNEANLSNFSKTGIYEFELYLIDSKGNRSDVELIKVNVIDPPPPPLARVWQESTQIKAYGNNNFFAYLSNSNKDVKFKWGQISGPKLYLESNYNETLKLSNLQPGNYVLSVTITDNFGKSYDTTFNFDVLDPIVIYPATPKNENIVSDYKMKGGPGNALINLIIPGLGHYYNSGDYNGDNRKKSSYIITASYFSIVGVAAYCKIKSNSEYQKYLSSTNTVEYLTNQNGTIIGVRGIKESEANQSYETANNLNKQYKNLILAAGGILVSDFIYTLYKGFKNQSKFKQDTKYSIGFNYNNDTQNFTTSIKVKL